MTRRLIFHIGHHKTGSTTIQDALARGELRAGDRRILYSAGMAHNYLRRHFDAFAADGTILPGSARFPGLSELSARLGRGDYDDAIFSAEEFEGADPAAMNRVLGRFFLPHVEDHRILCWVRPHAARTLSSFAEQLKLGLFGGDPGEFHSRTLRAGRLAYATRLAPWRATFGDRFRVRPMVRGLLAGGSILEDFAAEAFGPGVAAAFGGGGSANESLPLEDLALLRHLQSRLEGRGRKLRHAFGWEMAHLLSARPRPGTPTRLALHRRLAERIRADYRADARALDRGIFAATPVMERELDRAVDEALPEAQSLDPRDHFAPAELRAVEVMADLAVALLSNEGRRWTDHLVLRRMERLHGAEAGTEAEAGSGARTPRRGAAPA